MISKVYNQLCIQYLERGDDVNLEKIVSILIKLLEDQENVKITYKIISSNDSDKERESA